MKAAIHKAENVTAFSAEENQAALRENNLEFQILQR